MSDSVWGTVAKMDDSRNSNATACRVDRNWRTCCSCRCRAGFQAPRVWVARNQPNGSAEATLSHLDIRLQWLAPSHDRIMRPEDAGREKQSRVVLISEAGRAFEFEWDYCCPQWEVKNLSEVSEDIKVCARRPWLLRGWHSLNLLGNFSPKIFHNYF